MPEPIAHYQLLDPIGAGTLGPLHRARDLQRGRTVALRLVAHDIAADPARLEALHADVAKATAVLHTSIAAVYEMGDEDGQYYVASEFVPGQHLNALVAGSPLNPRRAVELAVQLADALAAAHGDGVVHGALDASAIVVTPKGASKVLDVGLRRWTRANAREPEDDIAGLGAVLFEMLVGRPLKRGWPAELRHAAVPPELQPVLQKMTATVPTQRYDSMALVAAALRAVSERLEAAREEVPMPAMTSKPHGEAVGAGTSALRGLVLVAGLAGLGALAWWLVGR